MNIDWTVAILGWTWRLTCLSRGRGVAKPSPISSPLPQAGEAENVATIATLRAEVARWKAVGAEAARQFEATHNALSILQTMTFNEIVSHLALWVYGTKVEPLHIKSALTQLTACGFFTVAQYNMYEANSAQYIWGILDQEAMNILAEKSVQVRLGGVLTLSTTDYVTLDRITKTAVAHADYDQKCEEFANLAGAYIDLKRRFGEENAAHAHGG